MNRDNSMLNGLSWIAGDDNANELFYNVYELNIEYSILIKFNDEVYSVHR